MKDCSRNGAFLICMVLQESSAQAALGFLSTTSQTKQEWCLLSYKAIHPEARGHAKSVDRVV